MPELTELIASKRARFGEKGDHPRLRCIQVLGDLEPNEVEQYIDPNRYSLLDMPLE